MCADEYIKTHKWCVRMKRCLFNTYATLYVQYTFTTERRPPAVQLQDRRQADEALESKQKLQ